LDPGSYGLDEAVTNSEQAAGTRQVKDIFDSPGGSPDIAIKKGWRCHRMRQPKKSLCCWAN